MKKRIYLFFVFLVLFIGGCKDNEVKAPPTPVPNPNSISTNQYTNQGDHSEGERKPLAISQDAMEILAQDLGKPLDQLTLEDLQEIQSYIIDSQERNIGNSFKALENLEELYIEIPIDDLSFLVDLPKLSVLSLYDFEDANLDDLRI